MGFRDLLFTNLKRTYSEKIVIRLTAVLFGLFHFTGLANGQPITGVILIAIMAATFGLSWGYMTAKTNSVIPSMILHYLVNAFSEVLLRARTFLRGQLPKFAKSEPIV
jgi:membrane protease YdiL (CAAX protease family)